MSSTKKSDDTVKLPVAESTPICNEYAIGTIKLFGSWVENGNEDEDIKRLYKSRLVLPGRLK